MSKRKRVISLVLALVACVSLFGGAAMQANAAVSWPSLSSSAYCEFTAAKQINVYRDSGLGTRGTSSPAKSYNAYISKGDVCKIYKITSSYIQVSYPTSSGNRTGYIKRSDVFGVSAPGRSYKASAKQTTYVTAGGASYGYIASGDTVYECGSSSGYTCVIYTAKSGSRAYKMGWIAAASSTASSTEKKVQARLDQIAGGELKYNSSTVLKVGSTFKGTRANEQCKGYAKNVFYLCFGVTPSSTKSNNYQLNATTGMKSLGLITGLVKGSSASANTIKALFSSARPGDFVQMKRQAGGPHSAILYSVSASGVQFLEANTDGANGIYLHTFTWAQLAQKNQAMTVYTATNYNLK